jgi:hypothetical protein
MLSMSLSQFEASEKLAGLAFCPSYQKAPFSTLFDHVKDDAVWLDQLSISFKQQLVTLMRLTSRPRKANLLWSLLLLALLLTQISLLEELENSMPTLFLLMSSRR